MGSADHVLRTQVTFSSYAAKIPAQLVCSGHTPLRQVLPSLLSLEPYVGFLNPATALSQT